MTVTWQTTFIFLKSNLPENLTLTALHRGRKNLNDEITACTGLNCLGSQVKSNQVICQVTVKKQKNQVGQKKVQFINGTYM